MCCSNSREVNSYKMHLAAVKSALPERVIPKPLDIRLPKELTRANMDVLRVNPARQDCKLAMYGKTLHTPVLAFMNEFTRAEHALMPPPVPVKKGKAKRVNPSALCTNAHSKALSVLNKADLVTSAPGDPVVQSDRCAPGFPVAFCCRNDCPVNLDRLDLDRRGLMQCPDLDGMNKLRFLNLQHNHISHLPHLAHLRHLIFLDVYNNCLTDMSAVSPLSSLRVLMLGKNRIQRICGLDSLTKLDVLDLHENQISRIENVSHLAELRVLNLAGNCISRVEKLQGLESLIELDLRNNHIFSVPQQSVCLSVFMHVRMRVRWPDGAVCRRCKVTGRMTEVDQLPCLQRLFLSANSISSFDELACLGDLCSLSELTLDGNPVAQESCYKQTVLRCVLPLRLLDMKRITEEDRRTANVLARKEDEKKRESHKQAAHKEKRRLAIRKAAQQWEDSRSFLELPAQNGGKDELSPENSPAHSPGQTNGIAQEPSPDDLRRDRGSPVTVPERPAGGSESKLRSGSRPNSPRDPRLQEAGGACVQSLSLSESHVAELDGETVRLFGPGALDTLERGWGVQTASTVTTIAFRYIQFDSIVPTLPRIRLKFPNLTHLIFMETNINRLLQLAALAQIKRLEQVTIDPEGNPVVSLTLWRSFLIYRLNHLNLQKINGTEVTMNDVIAAERIFGTLGHVASTETPHCRLLLLLEESRKRQLQFLLEGRVRRFGLSPEELRENGKLLGESMSRALFNYPNKDSSSDSPEESSSEVLGRSSVVDQYLRGLVRSASSTSVKGEALHKLWPTMFVEMVRDCVLETRDTTAYTHTCLDTLSSTK
ncbi:leucine-rich repeat-containing protein 49 isoform X3 [Tachysurus fulvidraco]|uniref:leucine-rich repeat-containing protein 49 isoform X3 n=1 Tax=Tachysurus fulvidraco TaxID=1234273 RepID=UPI001FED4394|nr:leucine-rich repeat-containing protein 49 isoform X3 [Tachysurus fulvidraco]